MLYTSGAFPLHCNVSNTSWQLMKHCLGLHAIAETAHCGRLRCMARSRCRERVLRRESVHCDAPLLQLLIVH